MSPKLFYYLMFYKLYKFGSLTRTKEESFLASSFIIGFLLVQWTIYILASLGIKTYIPKYYFWIAYIISIAGNIFFVMMNRKYEKIIEEIEIKKIPILFHIVFYLLMAGSFIGIIFL